jgi:hypothetical protein
VSANIRWGRIVLAAVLLEIAIIAVAVPVGLVFGNPLSTQPNGPPVNTTIYYVVVGLACLVLGAVFGAWAVRGASSGFAWQGLLVGIVAMALYFGLCSMAPGGLSGVIAGYGPAQFVMFNALRTIGCVGGAVFKGRQAFRSSLRPPR